MQRQKLLFVPVSSTKGIGEYMRSTIIATYFHQYNPNVEIHFILNEQVSYIENCQFNTHLVSKSPTACTNEVNNIITNLQPDIVIFDASGRAEQFKHAQNSGAKVVFISQHPRKRSKGLSLSRLPYIDVHWVAQPSITMTPLTLWQKVKLNLFNKPSPQNLGCLFMPSEQAEVGNSLSKYGVNSKSYILFSAGSGGHKLGEEWASEVLFQLAKYANTNYGLDCIFVAGASFPGNLPLSADHIKVISTLENKEFINLLSGAKLAVLSGGGSLLQAISLSVPTVSVAVAKDQPPRIKACYKQSWTYAAESNKEDLFTQFDNALIKENLNQMSKRLLKSTIKNGIQETRLQLEQLLIARHK